MTKVDTHRDALENKWKFRARTVTSEEKDKVGCIYLTEIMGLNEDEIVFFMNEKTDIYQRVGIRHSNFSTNKQERLRFWSKIRDMFPDMFTDDDFKRLVEGSDIYGFLFEINCIEGNISRVLRRLSVNATDFI